MVTPHTIDNEVKKIAALPYHREVVPNGDGTWFARVLEFPGCMTEGDSQALALEMLEDATALWIRAHLEDRVPIPEPFGDDAFSGKFVVRVSRSLHRDLTRRSELEGVSLNQFVGGKLAEAVKV